MLAGFEYTIDDSGVDREWHSADFHWYNKSGAKRALRRRQSHHYRHGGRGGARAGSSRRRKGGGGPERFITSRHHHHAQRFALLTEPLQVQLVTARSGKNLLEGSGAERQKVRFGRRQRRNKSDIRKKNFGTHDRNLKTTLEKHFLKTSLWGLI